MKRLTLCLLVLTAVPVLAQSSQHTFIVDNAAAPFNITTFAEHMAAPCEVNIVKVSFERPSRFMLITSGPHASSAPSLSVELQNHSSKKVVALDLLARIKVKDSIYQLDSVTREFPVHLTSGEGVQRLELVKNAVGFDSLGIQRVTYADGSQWQPEYRLACTYQGAGTMQIAK